MRSFEFEIISNLSEVEGSVEGYFAVCSNNNVAIPILECQHELDTLESDEKVIPIVAEEYNAGTWLANYLMRKPNLFAGIVTFGRHHPRYPTRQQQTHFAIVARHAVKHNPSLVLPLLSEVGKLDEVGGFILSPIHMHYGNVTVQDQLCTITVDETVPPLERPSELL